MSFPAGATWRDKWIIDLERRAEAAEVRVAELEAALERLVRPPALNLRDPANSGDLEAARHALKGEDAK